MILEPVGPDGTYLVRSQVSEDERGSFTRTFDMEIFRAAGLAWQVAQTSVSRSHTRGTLRGLHFQASPRSENKLVRCSRGSLWDVVADIRPQSPTFGQWCAFTLSEREATAVYVPAGCAHGYLTLEPDSEVCYQMDTAYDPAAATGVRFDDPILDISWPFPPVAVSARDLSLPLLATGAADVRR